jgi:hypothetical protein
MYSGRKSPRFQIAAPAMIYDVNGNLVRRGVSLDATKHGGSFGKNANTYRRFNCRWITTCPISPTP